MPNMRITMTDDNWQKSSWDCKADDDINAVVAALKENQPNWMRIEIVIQQDAVTVDRGA